MADKLHTPTPLAIARAMTTLIEGAYWPRTLKPHEGYIRRHDDTDGDRGPAQDLSVIIGPDGDCWVGAGNGCTLRFRTRAGALACQTARRPTLEVTGNDRRDHA